MWEVLKVPNTDRLIQEIKAMSKMSKIEPILLEGCNAMYVEDVEDRSNTPKARNSKYVEDVEDGNIHTYFKYCV